MFISRRKYEQDLKEAANKTVCEAEQRFYQSEDSREVFEEAYRKTDRLNFGLAIEAAKMGKKIARAGWNGKNMYVFLAESVEFTTMANMSEFGDQDVEVSDLLVLRTAQKTLQPGWLATQSDILADDWYIVE